MNLDQHSDILTAYLSRLPLADLRAIVTAAEYSQAAQLNQPTREQLRRELGMRQAVRDAVAVLILHDISLIEMIINRTIQKAQGGV